MITFIFSSKVTADISVLLSSGSRPVRQHQTFTFIVEFYFQTFKLNPQSSRNHFSFRLQLHLSYNFNSFQCLQINSSTHKFIPLVTTCSLTHQFQFSQLKRAKFPAKSEIDRRHFLSFSPFSKIIDENCVVLIQLDFHQINPPKQT